MCSVKVEKLKSRGCMEPWRKCVEQDMRIIKYRKVKMLELGPNYVSIYLTYDMRKVRGG